MYYNQVCITASKRLFNIKLAVALIFMGNREICKGGLRINGGRDALKEEFPFTVRLESQDMVVINGTKQFRYRQFCTGAALTPTWVLTAAHCSGTAIFKLFFHQDITQPPKRFARYNSHFPEESGHLSPITTVLDYPNYLLTHSIKHAKIMFDIALFQAENIKVSRYGKISAVDYPALVGHEVVLLGFGRNNAAPRKKPLQVLKGMLTKSDKKKAKVYGFLFVVPHCGQEATICGGDSGGPVIHASGIVGVNSISWQNCGKPFPSFPAAGVSMVSPFIDWLSNTITNKTNGR